MSHRIRSRARAVLLIPVLLALGLVLLPGPDHRLKAAACGQHGDLICKETTTCSKFWIFYYNCSSSYEYLSERNAEPEEEEEEPVVM